MIRKFGGQGFELAASYNHKKHLYQKGIGLPKIRPIGPDDELAEVQPLIKIVR